MFEKIRRRLKIKGAVYKEHLGRYWNVTDLRNGISEHIKHDLEDLFFVCIGSDRSTGDSYGPFVGMFLEHIGFRNVIGTIDYPVHATNLEYRLQEIPKSKKVIAIDASLSKKGNIGSITLYKGGLKPGLGVGKDLPAVGDYSITGCVNIGTGMMGYHALQCTRLSVVMHLAKQTADAIHHAFLRETRCELSLLKGEQYTVF